MAAYGEGNYAESNYGEPVGSSRPVGTLTATLPVITASFTGTYRDVGTFAATLPHPLTAAFAGVYSAPPTGTFAATLPSPITASFAGTYTAPVNPAGTFDAVLPVVTGSFAGAYHPHEAGTFSATLPSPLAATFSGTYTPGLETGSFAAVLPSPLAADFAGAYHPLGDHGALDAVLPKVIASFVGTYDGPVPTDTSNAMNGRGRHARATATVDRPAAALPPGRTFGVRYDKAIAYDRPTMVEGRPT